MLADAAAFVAADPAEALRDEIAARRRIAEQRGIAIAVRLAEGVAARGQRDGFLMVHRHARKGFLHVARHARVVVRVALRPFGIDVDQAHLDRGERTFELVQAVLGGDARLDALVDPLVFAAPIDVALGFEHVGAAAAEAEHRPAHALDRDIAGEDEQVGPADLVAVFLLDRPQQPPRLVEVAVVGPAVERREALLPAVRAAAAVGGAIGARGVPRHADEEGPVMAIVCRPPRLAVGHQRGQVILERLIVERLECSGIIEVGAQRVRRRHSD